MKSNAFISLVLVAIIAVNAATIGVLLMIKNRAEDRLQRVSTSLRELGAAEIEHLVRVDTVMDLDAEITIVKPITIDLAMELRDEVPVKMTVAVKQGITVPVEVDINEMIPLKNAAFLPEGTTVRAHGEIAIDQGVKWVVAGGAGPALRVEAAVPLDQDLRISFPEPISVTGDVPVKFTLKRDVFVPLDLEVPVDQKLDLVLGIKQQAIVGFPEKLHIRGQIPVKLDIPVRIPLRETPIKESLDKTSDALDGMLSFW